MLEKVAKREERQCERADGCYRLKVLIVQKITLER